jgi:hypothetical protein
MDRVFGSDKAAAMPVTRQSLLEHFQLLNNDALLALFQSGDLTDLAKEVAEEELRRRGVDLTKPAAALPVQGDHRSSSEDESTSASGDLVMIARYSTALDAQLLQSRLEVEGVPAFVVDDNIVQMNAFLTMAVGGVRVLVPESCSARAREIARGVERGDYALDENNKHSE